jgi:hypothetical protein
MEPIERYRGCLLGLAVGDALGTTLEFKPPGSFDPVGDMVGGGPFGLRPGEWTDDTSMALCLAESLIERRGFDPVDQLERYCRWYRLGHLSSTGPRHQKKRARRSEGGPAPFPRLLIPLRRLASGTGAGGEPGDDAAGKMPRRPRRMPVIAEDTKGLRLCLTAGSRVSPCPSSECGHRTQDASVEPP